MTGFQNPYLNPYGFVQPQQFQQPQLSTQVVKVNGENGARSYQIGANSSALLLDESGMMVWLVTSDGAGYRTVTAYDITPHKTEPAKYDSLESRIKRLEDIVNGSADSSAVKQKQYYASNSAGKADDGHGSYRTESATHAESTRNEQSSTETGYGYRSETRRRSDESFTGSSSGERD